MELNAISEQYMLKLLERVPHVSEEELRGAGFPDEVVERWKRIWNRPPIGKVHVATAREYRSNCQMRFFGNPTAVNDWFETNPGHILLEWQSVPGALGMNPGVMCVIGQILTPGEQADLDDDSAALAEMREKRAAEKTAAVDAYLTKLKAKQQEERRLLELGHKCEEHHAAVIEENRKLKDDLKKARKGNG